MNSRFSHLPRQAAMDRPFDDFRAVRIAAPVIEAWRRGFSLALRLGFGQELTLPLKSPSRGSRP